MKAPPGLSRSARYRWSVASRVLAAVGGGYALTSLSTVALPLLMSRWGMNQPQVVLAMSMAGFLFFAVIIMAVFHARSSRRAWAWLAGTCIPLALVVWLLLPGAPQ